MKFAYILRARSGAGKTTLAESLKSLYPEAVICTADDYFCVDGVYQFDAAKLGECHRLCREKFQKALDEGKVVICANTNTTEKERKIYVDMARAAGYTVFSLVVENIHGGENQHGVPEATLEKQATNIKNSLKL